MNNPTPSAKPQTDHASTGASQDTSTAYEKSQMDLNTAIDELRGAFETPPAKPQANAPSMETPVPPKAAAPSVSGGILDIPVELQVVLGSVEMLVSDLVNLKENSVVALDRNIGEPVDILVNGRRIARGEITVQDGTPPRLGIKLLDVSED